MKKNATKESIKFEAEALTKRLNDPSCIRGFLGFDIFGKKILSVLKVVN